jgi:hypothetical protein
MKMLRFKKSKNKIRKIKLQDQGILWYKKRLYVKEIKEIRELILCEAQDSTYSIHLGSTKMYRDLRSRYWWYGMKRAVAEYMALCDNCHTPFLKVANQSFHTCAQDVQITCMTNSKVNSSQCYDYSIIKVYLLQNDPWVSKRLQSKHHHSVYSKSGLN